MRYLLLLLALCLSGCETMNWFKPSPLDVGSLANECVRPPPFTAKDNESEAAFLSWQRTILIQASDCAANHESLVRILRASGYITGPVSKEDLEALNLIKPAKPAAPTQESSP